MFWCLSLLQRSPGAAGNKEMQALFCSVPTGVSVVKCRDYLRVEGERDEVNKVEVCFCGRQ